MVRIIIPLLFFLSGINAQIALPTFQGVHKPQTSSSSSSLYDFTTHTFTNCGATGKEGPTLANCISSYNTSWENNTDYFNVPSNAGIQYWTVPVTGTYTIEAYGAEGGDYGSSKPGGEGARMRGDFVLSANEIIRIVVGQRGDSYTNGSSKGGGGGGGSFVIRSPYNDVDSILVIAGGGGGSHYNQGSSPKDGNSGESAVTNTSTGSGYSAGGGGYNGSRATSGGNKTPGGSGGGSYNSGSNQSNSSGARDGHGQVIITIN